MPRLSDVWDGSTGTYLSKEQKESMSITKTAFYILDVSKRSGKFGPNWVLKISVQGNEYLCSLPLNAARDYQLEQVAEALKTFDEIGPVCFMSYPSSFGAPFLAIEEFDDD